MKKTTALHLVAAIPLLAGGVLLGRALFSGQGAASSTGYVVEGTAASRPARPAGRRVAAGDAPADRHDLASLIARHAAGTRSGGMLADAVGRLDTGALRTLALEQSAAIAAADPGMADRHAHALLLSATLHELWNRDGIAALEWASAVEGVDARQAAMKGLLENALREDPAAALPWMAKFRDEFGNSAANNAFLRIAVEGAATRSAEDVIRTFGMFSGTNLSNPLHSAEYPDGFDFARLHAALAGRTDVGSAISAWALQDREAAWDAVRKGLSGEEAAPHFHTPLTSLMTGVIAKEGEEAGVKWTMQQVAGLPPEERKRALMHLDAWNTLSVEGVALLAGALTAEEVAEIREP